MKKYVCFLLMLAALALMFCGCRMIIVEDAEPVRIGMTDSDIRLT